MKYEDNPKKEERKMKKAARKMGGAVKKGTLASIVGSAAMKAKKKDAYSGGSKPMEWAHLSKKKEDYKNKK